MPAQNHKVSRGILMILGQRHLKYPACWHNLPLKDESVWSVILSSSRLAADSYHTSTGCPGTAKSPNTRSMIMFVFCSLFRSYNIVKSSLFQQNATLWLENTSNGFRWYMGVSKYRGTPKWMVYHGKPYEQMDDLGGFPIFLGWHPYEKSPLHKNGEPYSTLEWCHNGPHRLRCDMMWLPLSSALMQHLWTLTN